MTVKHQTACIRVFAIAADGEATELAGLPTSEALPEAAYVWTHLHVQHEGAREWLVDRAKLDRTVVEAIMAEDTRPRALFKSDGVMLIFRAMNLHEGEPPEEMISLRMWIDEHRVISTRLRDVKAVEELQAAISSGPAPVSPAELLKSITSRIFARMEPFLDDLEDSVAAVEEIDELSARTQILTEEVRNNQAERLNRLAYIFSVVATIFLPLGFLTGLLGVNLSGIPAAQNPYAFWTFTAICIALIGMQVVFFKKLKWF